MPTIDPASAGPPVDLRRLVFPADGITVETLESDTLLFVADKWMLIGRPVDGREALKLAGTLERVCRSGPGTRIDVIQSPLAPVTIHCFVGASTTSDTSREAHYLVRIGDRWIDCTVVSAELGQNFNTHNVESFLFALSLADAPRPDAEVLRPWKQYQKARKAGTPNGKFMLFMAPAPVYVGSHDDYLNMLRTPSRQYPRSTPLDFQRGGKSLSPKVLEFYTKDDRSSVRIDVWVNGEPRDKSPREAVYADHLQVVSDGIEVWSSGDEKYPLAVGPGLYAVQVTLVNRGRTDTRHIRERERLQRDDLERYEVVMKLE